MTNHVVDGDTDRRRERFAARLAALRGVAAVAFIDRNPSLAANVLLGDAIKLGSRDARNNMRAQDFIGLGDEAPRLAQLRNLIGTFQ